MHRICSPNTPDTGFQVSTKTTLSVPLKNKFQPKLQLRNTTMEMTEEKNYLANIVLKMHLLYTDLSNTRKLLAIRTRSGYDNLYQFTYTKRE